jgi:hypothetical protein
MEPDIAATLFPFVSLEDIATKKENVSTKNTGEMMELPVNNYLKTHEEIIMDFQYGINRKTGLQGKRNSSGIPGTQNTTTDGYLNIHDLDKALSGFMEENY